MMEEEPVYLDYNATTPIAQEVADAVVAGLALWANPSSQNALGKAAKLRIEEARQEVARMLNAQSSEITFTSGGTESNHLALWSAIQNFRGKCSGPELPHIITTNIEHCAITKPLRKMEEERICRITFVPVVKGCVSLSSILDSVTDSTCLVTVMTANNETGVLQPVAQIGSALEELNQSRNIPILLHTDASQSIGKMAVDVQQLKVDLLTVTGHKFYGPRIGALYHRASQAWSVAPLFFGGGQEHGVRAGTENTAMILGLGAAARLVNLNLDHYFQHFRQMRDFLKEHLFNTFKAVSIDASHQLRLGEVLTMEDVPLLPNTLSIRFGGIKGSRLLELTQQTLTASTGAACKSLDSDSSVLTNSWNWDLEAASQTLRLSVGRETTRDQIKRVVEALKQTLQDLETNETY